MPTRPPVQELAGCSERPEPWSSCAVRSVAAAHAWRLGYWWPSARFSSQRSPLFPASATSKRSFCRRSAPVCAVGAASATPASAVSRAIRLVAPRKLVLIVIDGLTPAMLEQAVERENVPALRFLSEHGEYRRAITTFPSLTPVCLSTLATGAHPDIHEIPHLVWYHRTERRVIEYGSSFRAIRAAGARRSIGDTIYGLNASHLGRDAVTVYEALEDAGLEAAAVNITCYRGRTPHRPTVPFLTRPAYGPSRFFFYNLFESDVTGAPFSVRSRPRGTIDAYAAAVGRWLVTRDGFDFLVFYLSDYDYASHAQGPDAAHAALARCDDAVGTLIQAAGGPDEFLERYAVLLCSDHGQTPVADVARLQDSFPDAIVTASNRAGMVYADGDAAALAR